MESEQRITNKVIVVSAIGNPILDITSITDESTLKRFNLEFGKTVYVNKDNEEFFDVIQSQPNVYYTPGGSVTNSIRIANVCIF